MKLNEVAPRLARARDQHEVLAYQQRQRARMLAFGSAVAEVGTRGVTASEAMEKLGRAWARHMDGQR